MDAVDPQPPLVAIKKILLIKLKHIGDVLLATPCIRALHHSFPDARISALVNEDAVPVLQNHPLLENVLSFPRSSISLAMAVSISAHTPVSTHD